MSSTIPALLVQARPVWLVSAFAGMAAATATELYGLAARAAGIPMEAGGVGAAVASPITVGMFAMGTLLCTVAGTALAMVLTRYAAHPARVYVRTTLVLVAVSFVSPLAAGDTAVSTKLMLVLAHCIAASVIIPTVARRLGRHR
jgi:Family of unknown function (DUF6069)